MRNGPDPQLLEQLRQPRVGELIAARAGKDQPAGLGRSGAAAQSCCGMQGLYGAGGQRDPMLTTRLRPRRRDRPHRRAEVDLLPPRPSRFPGPDRGQHHELEAQSRPDPTPTKQQGRAEKRKAGSAPNSALYSYTFYNKQLTKRNGIFVPHPFTISIWTQSHSARPLGPAADGWRIGLHPLDDPPAALVPLLGLVPEPCSSTRSPGRWPARSSASSPSERCSRSRAGRTTWRPAWSGRGRPDHAGVAAVAGHHHGDRSGDGRGRRADADARLGRR